MAEEPDEKVRRLRVLFEEHLRNSSPDGEQSIHNWFLALQSHAVQLGIWHPALAVEIFGEFERQGVVARGGKFGIWMGSQPPPEFVVTRWGREVLSRSGPSPHDQEGYFRAAIRALGGSDLVVERLLSEAVGAFNGGHYLASAALLGFTCERVLRRLAVDIHHALPEGGERSRFYDKGVKVGEGSRGAKQPRVGDVMEQIRGVVERGSLGLSLKIKYETRTMLEGIFQIVTVLRDSVAHDDDPIVQKGEIEARLLMLPYWLAHVREIRTAVSRGASAASMAATDGAPALPSD